MLTHRIWRHGLRHRPIPPRDNQNAFHAQEHACGNGRSCQFHVRRAENLSQVLDHRIDTEYVPKAVVATRHLQSAFIIQWNKIFIDRKPGTVKNVTHPYGAGIRESAAVDIDPDLAPDDPAHVPDRNVYLPKVRPCAVKQWPVHHSFRLREKSDMPPLYRNAQSGCNRRAPRAAGQNRTQWATIGGTSGFDLHRPNPRLHKIP